MRAVLRPRFACGQASRDLMGVQTLGLGPMPLLNAFDGSALSAAVAEKGAGFGGARGRTDVPKIVDWYMGGRIEIDPMIAYTLTLDEINKGFDMMYEGKSIRSMVVY